MKSLLPRRSFVCRLAGSVVAATGLTPLRAADGWRNLPLIKDGRVAPEWAFLGYGKFSVDNGTLRTDCAPEGLGLLIYRKEPLGNCQLRVVFKTKDARSNSGIYVRIADGILDQVSNPGPAFVRDSKGTPSDDSMAKVKAAAEKETGAWYAVHRGYEVQIDGSGDTWHRTGAIYSLAPVTGTPGRPADEWQTMVITLKGETITVDLNGQQVSSFDPQSPGLPPRKLWHEPKREPKRPVVGYFGLQTHDPGDVVWFKEVSVRPL
jgi:hypothetical protein